MGEIMNLHNMPVCTLEGNRELHIENYGSLGDYCDTKIVLQCKRCKLIIEGTHLNIEYFTDVDMKIKGCIHSIKI